MGISPLYSKKGFMVAWEEYQGMLVEGLNGLIAGTTLEDQTALDIAIQTSRRPELAATFNFASQAHNNHFFFESLVPANAAPPPDSFTAALTATFPNFGVLKMELIATALSLFGSGTVWLVLDRQRRLRILATYNAGTPYPGAHGRRQDIDTNTLSSPSQSSSYYGAYGNDVLDATLAAAKSAGGISWPIPLLSVSVWPQVYMIDYGVSLDGKRKYLENWWDCIDWSVVMRRFHQTGAPRAMMSY